jgi:type III secretion system YscJ/HrcJ family lipoprotein
MTVRNRLAPCMAIALAGALALAGCKKEIYHGLTESEANEVLVTLKAANIVAEKVPAGESKKGATFDISVDEELAVDAMRVLLEAQLPRVHQRGLNEVFAQQSMIPTETEEKARYLQALQGDLVNSLEEIDGIVDARVHLVLPEANPLEGGDLTKARASILVKYDPQRGAGTESETLEQAVRWRDLLMAINDDLKKLKIIWTKELPALSTEEERLVATIEAYLSKRSDDADAKDALQAMRRLRGPSVDREPPILTKRLGLQNALAALPKLKDLDAVITKATEVEMKALPMPSATIRSLVARATPRLSEDDVAVEFTKVVAKPQPGKVNTISLGVRRDYFLAAAGAAGALALGLVGMALWVMSLKKAVAKAEARARAAAAGGSMGA